jgi:hypothetical protein
MTLKITTVLLSSVLASASYASEGVERSPTEIAVPQQGVIQKAAPDNFAKMLSEAVGVARLGLEIFGRLSTL